MKTRTTLHAASLLVAYYAVSLVGIAVEAVTPDLVADERTLLAINHVASIVSFPSGVGVAALLVFGLRLFWVIAIGSLAANLSAGLPGLVAIGMAVGSTLEAVAFVWLARRSGVVPASGAAMPRLPPRSVAALLACTVVGASLNASCRVLAVEILADVGPGVLALTFRAALLGSVLGVMIVTPFVLVLPTMRRSRLVTRRSLELLAALSMLVLLSWLAFATFGGLVHRSYLVFPLVLWLALRFQLFGAALASLVTAILSLFATHAGLGPFAYERQPQGLFELQAFLAVISLTALMLGAVSDSRRRAGLALARENAFVSAILGAAGPIVVLDAASRIVRQNRACERIVSSNPVGKVFEDVFCRTDERERVHDQLALLGRSAESVAWESHCALADGEERVLTWSGTPLFDASGAVEHMIISGNDITERRKLEAQLVAADRLAAIGTLAAGLGHEINNPLAYARLSIELAKKAALRQRNGSRSDAGSIDTLLDTALEGADRVQRIVADLKVLARGGEVRRSPVDVNAVLDACIPIVWNEIRHRARLIKAYGAVPLASADDSRLSQVFLNLLINAAHAIPEGDVEHNYVQVATGVDDEGRVYVEIGDTGTGLDADTRRRLFEPFFTTKPAGTGLGLSVCHAIVTSLGGTIDVASEQGRGSSFRVSLPRSGGDVATHEMTSVSPAITPSVSLRILIADDERVLARTLALLVPDHAVDVVTSGRAALDCCLARDYDLIFCDLLMLDLSGMDIYSELARLRPGYERRIVFMSGGAFTPRAREFLERVDNPRLEKPFAGEELVAFVQTEAARLYESRAAGADVDDFRTPA